MAPPTLETRDLTIRFGGHVAVDAVSCAFERGTLTAIVGPNGAGKTTYFNLISGQLRATAGSVWLDGRDLSRAGVAERTRRGIGRAFQLTNLFPNLTVRENVRLVAQARARRGFDVLSMAETHAALIKRADEVLAQVRLLHVADRKVAALPHGDQRKLEVAMLIALESPVLMFDEPTAGMSVDEVPVILALVTALKADRSKTILLVEHKMDVIRSLADRIVVFHNGRLVADGVPQEVMASPIVQEAYLGVEAARA
ncbi:MAG TPA: ABC transporter ATP-binding protein [Hyphomicrobiaceae bacterium]|jgi:branched-chain amino acid transport system ATP-binding protein|nr:ABC transporter ATP-binding protein [Hyphomicrobiaceae bacterium]